MTPKILVVAKFHIGDVVMATSAISLLKKIYPDSQITAIVPPIMLSLLTDSDDIESVLAEPVSGNKLSQSWQKFLYVLKRRKAKFDMCFFLGESKNIAKRYARFANIPVRVCAAKDLAGKNNPLAPYCTHVITTRDPMKVHVVDYLQDIIRGFSNSSYASEPGLPDYTAVTNELSSLPAGRKNIAFCCKGAATSLTRWPKKNFTQLLDRLHKDGYNILTAVPPDQVHYVSTINSATTNPFHIFTTHSLRELAEILTEVDLLISVDTGQVHIAAALGTPVLSLGGCTANKTYPYSKNGYLLSTTKNCFDCRFISECNYNKVVDKYSETAISPCMSALSVEAVYEHADNILNKKDINKIYDTYSERDDYYIYMRR